MVSGLKSKARIQSISQTDNISRMGTYSLTDTKSGSAAKVIYTNKGDTRPEREAEISRFDG